MATVGIRWHYKRGRAVWNIVLIERNVILELKHGKEVHKMAFGTIGKVNVWTTKKGIGASIKKKSKSKKGKKK
jgi:hypothetical protein